MRRGAGRRSACNAVNSRLAMARAIRRPARASAHDRRELEQVAADADALGREQPLHDRGRVPLIEAELAPGGPRRRMALQRRDQALALGLKAVDGGRLRCGSFLAGPRAARAAPALSGFAFRRAVPTCHLVVCGFAFCASAFCAFCAFAGLARRRAFARAPIRRNTVKEFSANRRVQMACSATFWRETATDDADTRERLKRHSLRDGR
jgi:hypothetical protein